MPNHIHGIVQLVGAPLAGARVPNTVSRNNDIYDGFRATARVAPTVGNIIGAYKSLCVQNCLQWIKSNNPAFHIEKCLLSPVPTLGDIITILPIYPPKTSI